MRQESAAKGSGGEKPPHFFMRKAIAASVVLLVVAGCSSGAGNSNTANAAPQTEKTEIRLAQLSDVPIAARHTDGMLSVQYALRVENLTAEAITLRQVTVQTISIGGYSVNPTSKPFNVAIEPKQKQEVEFWVPALAGNSVVGANGPVTLRITCVFDSPTGKFQQIAMQRVNENTSITGTR